MAAEPDETPILTLLATMTAASLEATNLDPDTLMLVRIAALVAVDAPAASYLMNLGVAGRAGVSEDQIEGVLAAVAPIVGTTRIIAAATHMMQALGLKIDLESLQAGN
jgi:alkylhydroperoxidase/carboxymuconolactone decarboxylase family protein YurZ